jgi:small GTP-binding protein
VLVQGYFCQQSKNPNSTDQVREFSDLGPNHTHSDTCAQIKMATPAATHSIKAVFVGDSSVGKTSFLQALSTNRAILPGDRPSLFDNSRGTVVVDGKQYSIGLFDTAGEEEYDCMRVLSYSLADAFVIVFAHDLPSSFENVRHKWIPELRKNNEAVPIVLVGMKTDKLPKPQPSAAASLPAAPRSPKGSQSQSAGPPMATRSASGRFKAAPNHSTAAKPMQSPRVSASTKPAPSSARASSRHSSLSPSKPSSASSPTKNARANTIGSATSALTSDDEASESPPSVVISPEQALGLAKEFGLHVYVGCSAVTGDGFGKLCYAVVNAVNARLLASAANSSNSPSVGLLTRNASRYRKLFHMSSPRKDEGKPSMPTSKSLLSLISPTKGESSPSRTNIRGDIATAPVISGHVDSIQFLCFCHSEVTYSNLGAEKTVSRGFASQAAHTESLKSALHIALPVSEYAEVWQDYIHNEWKALLLPSPISEASSPHAQLESIVLALSTNVEILVHFLTKLNDTRLAEITSATQTLTIDPPVSQTPSALDIDPPLEKILGHLVDLVAFTAGVAKDRKLTRWKPTVVQDSGEVHEAGSADDDISEAVWLQRGMLFPPALVGARILLPVLSYRLKTLWTDSMKEFEKRVLRDGIPDSRFDAHQAGNGAHTNSTGRNSSMKLPQVAKHAAVTSAPKGVELPKQKVPKWHTGAKDDSAYRSWLDHAGSIAHPKLVSTMHEIIKALRCGSLLLPSPSKANKGEAHRRMLVLESKGGTPLKNPRESVLTDLVRAMIVLDTPNQLLSAFQCVREQMEVVFIRNDFAALESIGDGFRCVVLSVRVPVDMSGFSPTSAATTKSVSTPPPPVQTPRGIQTPRATSTTTHHVSRSPSKANSHVQETNEQNYLICEVRLYLRSLIELRQRIRNCKRILISNDEAQLTEILTSIDNDEPLATAASGSSEHEEEDYEEDELSTPLSMLKSLSPRHDDVVTNGEEQQFTNGRVSSAAQNDDNIEVDQYMEPIDEPININDHDEDDMQRISSEEIDDSHIVAPQAVEDDLGAPAMLLPKWKQKMLQAQQAAAIVLETPSTEEMERDRELQEQFEQCLETLAIPEATRPQLRALDDEKKRKMINQAKLINSSK